MTGLRVPRLLVGFWFCLVLLVGCLPSGLAQTPQLPINPLYEVGRRTVALERAWQTAFPFQKRDVLPVVTPASAAFLSGRIQTAAQLLDETTGLLRGERRTPAAQWADAVAAEISARLIDIRQVNSQLILFPFYTPSVAQPTTLRVELRVEGTATPLAASALTLDPARPTLLPFTFPAVRGTRGIDTFVTVRILDGQTAVREWRLGISRVRNLRTRLDAFRTAVAALPASAPRTDLATLQYRAQLLQRIAGGQSAEADLPCARLLAEGETALAVVTAGRSFFTGQTGEVFLAVRQGTGLIPVRAFIPTGNPATLIFAIHGAGLSENAFFVAYGAGAAVEFAKARNYAFIGTNNNAIGTTPVNQLAVLDEVQGVLVPNARNRFVLGHSAGAGATLVVGLAGAARLAGIAMVSYPSTTIPDLRTLGRLPAYVGVGTQDLAPCIAAAPLLTTALDRNGNSNQFRQYEAEHLLVVTDALPDVFAWFDAQPKQ